MSNQHPEDISKCGALNPSLDYAVPVRRAIPAYLSDVMLLVLHLKIFAR